MKKLILKMSMSLDGFVATTNGKIDWLFPSMSADGARWTIGTISNASMHLMGSRTYHDMAAWWPNSKEDFAAPMNEIPKAIFSRRGVKRPDPKLTTQALKSAQAANGSKLSAKASSKVMESWLNPKVFTGNMAAGIKQLKRGRGKPLVAHGGASFAKSLIATGLVDEFHLLIHPVVLGRGLAIFSDLKNPLHLQLLDSKRFKSGTVAQIYRAKK